MFVKEAYTDDKENIFHHCSNPTRVWSVIVAAMRLLFVNAPHIITYDYHFFYINSTKVPNTEHNESPIHLSILHINNTLCQPLVSNKAQV